MTKTLIACGVIVLVSVIILIYKKINNDNKKIKTKSQKTQSQGQGSNPPPTPKKRWGKLKRSDITSSLWIIILFCVAAILIVFALNFIYETFKEKPEQSNGNTLFGPDSLTDYGYRQGSQSSSSSPSPQKVGYLQIRDTIYYGGEYGEFFQFNGRDIHFLNPSSSYCIKSTNEEEFCGRQYEDIYYKMCPNCEYTLKFKRGGNDLSSNKDSVIVLYKKFF